jgi:type VI secretion system protein ImpA
MLNVEALLQPVSGEAPAGANLEYSPEFAELELTAAGKPERQIGASVVAAEEPEWAALVAQATDLLRATKDLRVANHMVRGLLRIDGFVGLADGLQLLRGLVDRYWPTLHPQMDEDDHDATSRINAMAALIHRDVLQAIRTTPIVGLKGVGVVTLREIDTTLPTGQPPSPATEAVLQQIPLADLAEAARTIQRCCDEARGLAASWSAVLDVGAPDFAELRRLLEHASQVLKERLERRQPTPNGAGPSADSAVGSARGAVEMGGDLRSREDVLRALDAVSAYYARHEPSSPVPLLVERCKRLVTMSFLEIVKDMLPEGVSTLQAVVGKTKD